MSQLQRAVPREAAVWAEHVRLFVTSHFDGVFGIAAQEDEAAEYWYARSDADIGR